MANTETEMISESHFIAGTKTDTTIFKGFFKVGQICIKNMSGRRVNCCGKK
jgi:hypothetical protein